PLSVIFILMSEDRMRTGLKTAASVVVYTIFCGIVELIVKTFTLEAFNWMDFYHRSVVQPGGGLAGALWIKLLYPWLGSFGTYLVLIVLALIGLVFITEKSLLSPLRQGSEKMFVFAKEDMERRREEREIRRQEREIAHQEELALQREDRQYRMDNLAKQKARTISLTPEKPVEEKITPNPQKNEPVMPIEETGSGEFDEIIYDEPTKTASPFDFIGKKRSAQKLTITGLNTEPVKAENEEKNAANSEVMYELPKRESDAISANQDTRTLSELESLDSLHSGFSKRNKLDIPDILHMPDDRLESRPEDGYRIETELPETVIGSDEDEYPAKSVRTDVPLTLNQLRSATIERASIEEPEKKDLPQIPITVMTEKEMTDIPVSNEDRGGDTMRVVTASGRVIEVDNDPTIDPLSAKRAGRTQGQAAMTDQAMMQGNTTGNPHSSGSRSLVGRYASNGTSTPATTTAQTTTATPEATKPKVKRKPYEKPPLRLLKAPVRKNDASRENDLRETAMKLQQTLQNFGVGATVTNISCGPSVTRFELIPDQGVKVSKFVSLTNDIKLTLAAADIRMEAPIPGKSAIGIEVPNKERASVTLREVLESEEFLKHPSKLAIAVGKDVSGNTIVSDLARMPHLLVAGTTGSGKSVCINCMIMSMLYKATPDEVKFIMIDPKMVEFGIYNGIPHLLSPVVTDPKKAAEVLGWAVLQMTDRYKKFAELNVRDIKGYNEKQREEAEETGEKPELMPQIVIIVDELADLMMAAPSEVEDAIVRLAQMARAAGIHLILATQRPSVNVVTGLIKANIPSRAALSVSTGVDSRTILDMNGAEKLLGNGDMLFYPSGYQKPLRVQGAYVSDSEINQIVSFLSERGEVKFDESIEQKLVQNSNAMAGSSDRDEYFERAGRFIVESQKASIGNLQRMFKIGFNRAARIMDQLADAGVVGPDEGTKARKILMTPEQLDEFFGR
ncbi:MAG: DNA translocase FtsK 4TM domain-containing protein, partial [Lachnospiraceae bacterium]|nr:DNA translocase FtsK 4TM domain-containing protein [Lachnospiraceae bacterium]